MDWSKRDWFFCLILAVVTILAYQPAWHGGFVWDDAANIAAPELRSLDGLRRIWPLSLQCGMVGRWFTKQQYDDWTEDSP